MCNLSYYRHRYPSVVIQHAVWLYVGHDGVWSDALLLEEFSHQLERRLAISPCLNRDVQDLAFAVHGALSR